MNSLASAVTLPLEELRRPSIKRIAMVVSTDSYSFDVSTISTIFAYANRLRGRTLYEVTLVGHAASVLCEDGMVLSTVPLEQMAEPVDMLFMTGNAMAVPSGLSPRQRLTQIARASIKWCAIDNGVLALASLGFLSRRKVSVRHDLSRLLARSHPELIINDNKLFTHDRNLWTCPSGAPVVDMCLTLVEDDFGRKVANAIAHELLIPGRRSSDQPQISPVLLIQSRGGRDRPLAALVDWINQNVNARIDIPTLATRVSMSERTFHRRFKAYTGYTPADYINQVRAGRARQLMLGDVSLKEVAGYVGFASPSTATRALKRADRATVTGIVRKDATT